MNEAMKLSLQMNGGVMVTRKDVLAAFQFRHATKRFDETKKISDQDFEIILEAGRLSPSSFGFEPWRFLVVQNPQLREELKMVTWGAQGQLPTASHYVAIACLKDGMRYDSSHITHMMRDVQHLSPEMMEKKRERFREFQKQNGILETPRTLFDWAVKQSYIALGNMMTAAAFLGIDSCAIEGGNMSAIEKILAENGLLDNGRYGLGVMVAFGYRLDEPPAKTRQPLEDIVVWVR